MNHTLPLPFAEESRQEANTIAALNEQISALQSALNNLQATVNSKVSQDDFNSLQSVVTVSYTHLDVYKRQ